MCKLYRQGDKTYLSKMHNLINLTGNKSTSLQLLLLLKVCVYLQILYIKVLARQLEGYLYIGVHYFIEVSYKLDRQFAIGSVFQIVLSQIKKHLLCLLRTLPRVGKNVLTYMLLVEKVVNFRKTLIKSVNASKVAIRSNYPRTQNLVFIKHLSNFK